MNSLDRSLLVKAGGDNGWEFAAEAGEGAMVLRSARHPQEVDIEGAETGWKLFFQDPALRIELARKIGRSADPFLHARTLQDVDQALLAAAELAMALPSQPLDAFHQALKTEGIGPEEGATGTETQRLTRVRIGQSVYRDSLLRYWGGACAVTGIALPELLRASHAKPWALCATDAERLDSFNGFLLAAHLDALFDQGLMTFSGDGSAIFGRRVDGEVRERLGIQTGLRLRWIAPSHVPYLAWHRDHVFQG